jgi:excisionase family DNA binding protein
VSPETAGELLMTHEVAERLHVSPKTVVRWANAGLVPCLATLGGHRRFRREDVDAIALRMQQSGGRS